MPTPTLVTVNGDLAPDSQVEEVRFTVPTRLNYNAGPDVIVPHTVVVAVPTNGVFQVQLYGTNDPDWSPTNWNYKVTLVGPNLTDTFYIQVPFDAGTINFGTLLPSLTPSQGTLYAAVNHTHEGGGGSGPDPSSTVVSETSYGQAATAGNVTTYARGNHTHGTPALGTTASTAAAGNHNHDAAYSAAGHNHDASYSATGHNHTGTYDAAGTASTLVAAHEADTTAVHGIANTANLVLTNDSRLSDARTPTAHNHAAADVNSGTLAIARIPTGTTSSTVALGDHTHAGGGSVTIARGYVTSGDVTPQNTGGNWQALTGGPTFQIAAANGDEVVFEYAALMERNLGTFYDACVLVGGSPSLYAATGTNLPAVEGDPGWYPDVPSYIGHAGPFAFAVTSGMISGGLVTVGFAVKSGGSGKLFAGTSFPLRWLLVNYG